MFRGEQSNAENVSIKLESYQIKNGLYRADFGRQSKALLGKHIEMAPLQAAEKGGSNCPFRPSGGETKFSRKQHAGIAGTRAYPI